MCYFANVLIYGLLISMKVLGLAHRKRYFHRMVEFTILSGVCARKCRCLSHAYLCRVFSKGTADIHMATLLHIVSYFFTSQADGIKTYIIDFAYC